MCNGMAKKKRQLLIKQIISQHQIESQQQLLDKLNESGIEATQATISRDIRELKIVKTHDTNGKIKYGVLPEKKIEPIDHLKEVFKEYVTQVTHVQVMNVINTSLGAANIVAADLDELSIPEIVGSLAGTDTIVLISRSEEDAKRLNGKFLSYLE
ncbi:MAG TPA: arginine repressor [Vagococcus sp.]|nr:arginine repressor [Vagococcus sp.]